MGGVLSGMLDNEGKNKSPLAKSSSDDGTTTGGLLGQIKDLFKPKSSGKSDSSSTGAGDLGDMSTGLASAKKGGTVKKSGFIKMHKGEKVLTKKQAKKYSTKGPRKRA